MYIDAHLAKAKSFEGSIAKLDPAADFEMLIWCSMSVATHLLNAALHASGVTEANQAYPSMNPGKFMVPAPGLGFREEPGKLGDVVHADMPGVPGPVPPKLAEAMDALRIIERMGTVYVRSPKYFTPQALDECRRAYEASIRGFLDIIQAGKSN